MAQVSITRVQARRLFDKLAPQVNEQTFRDAIFKKRLALVYTKDSTYFIWLDEGSKDVDKHKIVWLDLYAKVFYEVVPPRVYKRKPIGASVEYLYKKTNTLVQQKDELGELPNAKSETNTPKKKANSYKTSLSEWDPSIWDKDSYQEPYTTRIEGYMGGSGWKGSKRDKVENNPVAVIDNIRYELKQAIKAGYIPDNLGVTVRNNRGSMYFSYTMTVRFKVSESEVPHLGELYKRLERIFNAYNYDESNSQFDYFDKGYYTSIKLEYPE